MAGGAVKQRACCPAALTFQSAAAQPLACWRGQIMYTLKGLIVSLQHPKLTH